jgi:DNA-binding protein YbaB
MELPDLNKVLGLDISALAEQAQQQVTQTSELRERLAGLVGRAETADGRLRLAISPERGLTELNIDPRMMRLGSEELAGSIRDLTRKAIDDLKRQKQEAARETFGPDYDPEAAIPDPEAIRGTLGGLSDAADSAGQSLTAMMEQLQRRLQR